MQKSKFSIGDIVSVLDDVITGKIVAIHNKRITIIDANEFRYSYNENELVLKKTFDFKIEKKAILKNKESVSSKTQIKTKTILVIEVDLHIHQITDCNTKNWSNFEILSYQLNYAKQKLAYAMKNKIPKIIFIHGKGKGVLRAELQQLFLEYPVAVQDASYIKYGFGAMEVRFKSFKCVL